MLRSYKERIVQSLVFEWGGLVLSLPFIALFTNDSPFENLGLLLCITIAVLNWTPLHNLIFDRIDLRLSGRVASDRPQVWRVVHALSHEGTSMLVSLPILVWVGGMDLKTAIIVDVGLTVIYTLWAWAFHVLWDNYRPILPSSASLPSQ